MKTNVLLGKLYLKIAALVLFIATMIGYALPALISHASTEGPLLGLAVGILSPVFIGVWILSIVKTVKELKAPRPPLT